MKRRVAAVLLFAIALPGLLLSYGSLQAVRSDRFVLAKLREERLAAAAHELRERIEEEARDRSRRALLELQPERLAERAAGLLVAQGQTAPGFEDLEVELERVREREPLIREALIQVLGGPLLLPRPDSPSGPAPAVDSQQRSGPAEARRAERRAYATELASGVLADLQAAAEASPEPSSEVLYLATVGGRRARLVAYRIVRAEPLPAPETGPQTHGGQAALAQGSPPTLLVAVEIDLARLTAETVEPWVARIARDRKAAIAVLDRRGRPVAAAGGEAAQPAADTAPGQGRSAPAPTPPDGAVTEVFESLLPFWRARAGALPGDDESRLARFRLLLQLGMVALLTVAISIGAWWTMRAVDRSLELSRLKSEFVSHVSHELRTPLTSIRMFAEMLQTGRARTPERANEYLATIVRESERLRSLIDDILEFARHEEGRAQYDFRPDDAGEVIEEALAGLREQLAGAGFHIRLQIDRPLPQVVIDRRSLVRAIQNLVANASKYTADSKEIAVTARSEGDEVVVEVADRGIGIDADELPRVFEKFFRGRDALALGIAGSGLGLALVKRVVEDHGGSVCARSKRGEGSTFTIRLPAAVGPADLPRSGVPRRTPSSR